MKVHLQAVLPEEIERRSFEIITAELGERALPPEQAPIIKRVIHTTADFGYADTLYFSPGAVEAGLRALRQGARVVTDTRMAWSGIHKSSLERLGGEALCFMGEESVAQAARQNGCTRSAACMDRAARLEGPVIFAIGNAPTALVRLYELMEQQAVEPALIIGVPVGFVNVVESKELIIGAKAPCIVARGRKGGSNVAAAIVNALLYQATGER